uniref:Potassium channel domain-containing protein n=1 Tax=Grammatophora oceanica TaxID=210454 RepID=A0A6U5MNB7_9STRA
MVTNYLHWSFRSSFLVFVLSGALVFFALTLIFALLMWVVGQYEPHCIHVNGQDFGDEVGDGNEFSDAFALSWTTFSTVGYGLVFPSSSATSQRPHECIGLQMLCTLEAFVGILFASMCGAILFGKVGRVRSQAQVIFSDPMVIRYGTGVLIGGDDSMSSNGGGNASGPIWLRTPRTRSSGDIPPPPSTPPPPPPPSMSPRLLSNRRFLPCPVLEFRVVNRLHNSLQGEIIDASMSIIASIDEDQARAAMEGLSKRGRRRRGRIRGVRMQHGQPTIKEARALGPAAQQRVDDSLASLAARVHERARQRHQAFVEDNDGFLVNRRVFVKLDVETPDHPFFKRVWILKHELNENSPLLSAEARRAVKLNQSFWPQELNSYSAVRDAIQFDQILVSLSGTSNADANSVYAQKIYRHSDVNVGWRFVNLLYRDELDGGTVRVDHRKINDVVEQAGGGGEPFMNPEESERNDLATIPI